MKRLLKNLIVPLLANRKITSLAHRIFDCGIPIFMLHRIAPHGQTEEGRTDPEHLRNCLNYLHENNYTCISLEELITALNSNTPLPSKSVCFTMDDGYTDQAQIAAPIFIEYSCPVTFFVITGMLGQPHWPWDAKVSWLIESSNSHSLQTSEIIKQLGIDSNQMSNKREFRRAIQDAIKTIDAEVIPDIMQQLATAAKITIPDTAPKDYRPMNWDEARQLESRGICFAPHSVTHNILSRLSQKSMEQEVNQSWEIISHELSNPLKVFCYPTGRSIDFGNREIAVLKKANYLGAVSTTPDFVMNNKHSREQLFDLPRLSLPDDMTDFVQYCSWMESIKSRLNK